MGAARDTESAGEFKDEEGNSFGLFTHNLFKVMNNSQPGETWDDIFKKTKAQMASSRIFSQHPQIEGKANKEVFNGEFQAPIKTISIVKGRGDNLKLKAGSLAGVTVGSLYRLHTPNTKKKNLHILEIIKASRYSSKFKVVKGSFKEGDLVVEEKHAYPYEPFNVFLGHDYEKDNSLVSILKKEILTMPGWQVT